MKQKAFSVAVDQSTYQHTQWGQVTFTAVAAVPGEYTFSVNNATYNIWCHDITQTSFAINSDYPNAGSTGSWGSGALNIANQVTQRPI